MPDRDEGFRGDHPRNPADPLEDHLQGHGDLFGLHLDDNIVRPGDGLYFGDFGDLLKAPDDILEASDIGPGEQIDELHGGCVDCRWRLINVPTDLRSIGPASPAPLSEPPNPNHPPKPYGRRRENGGGMALRLRDTRTGSVRTVTSGRPGPLALYVCGPTVYDAAHVGHGRTYLYFDLLRRTLESRGIPVRHVMNVTDFEDKVDVRAAELGMTWKQLARMEERRFFSDLRHLGVRMPHVTPRASDFVSRMVEVARRLDRTGRVHRQGDAWFYTPPERRRWKNFPIASELEQHAVPEPGHPLTDSDGRSFLVWKLQRPPLPSWSSPWGPGAPGWQLECYAMADHYLGMPVDLHGGGQDLIYPHHFAGNEIAFALDGSPFSRVFFHAAFVLREGQKMSKSQRNLVSLSESLRAVGAGALRWYLAGPAPTERLEWDSRRLRRATEKFAVVEETLRRLATLSSEGSIGADKLHALADGVAGDLERGFRPDRAILRIESFCDSVRRRGTLGPRRGDRRAARTAIARLEQLTGWSFGAEERGRAGIRGRSDRPRS